MSAVLKILFAVFGVSIPLAYLAMIYASNLEGIATVRFPASDWEQLDLRKINTATGSGLSGTWKNSEEERLTILCWQDFPPLLDPPVMLVATHEITLVGQVVSLRQVTDNNTTFFIAGTFEAGAYRCTIQGDNFVSQARFEQFLAGVSIDAEQVILPAH